MANPDHGADSVELDALERAGEYRDGYCAGRLEGHRESSFDDSSSNDSKAYQDGFTRGFDVAKLRIEADRVHRDEIAEAVQEVDRLAMTGPDHFSEEERGRWRALQGKIKQNGQKSYQNILLEMLYDLRTYESASTFPDQERKALNLVRNGILARFAKTSF